MINVLLGMFFLGERLRKLQWFAVSLAAIGVIIQLISRLALCRSLLLPSALVSMACYVKRLAWKLKPAYLRRW